MIQQFAHHWFRILSLGLAFACALVLGFGGASQALANETPSDWDISLADSSLTFTTTKSGVAGVGGATETNRFKSFKGGLNRQGRIQLQIELRSVDSGVQIRDERLKTLLWNVATQPSVQFSAQIDPQKLKQINDGKGAVPLTVDGKLTMAGQSVPIKAQLLVVAMKGNLWVSTREAIVIDAKDFGLTPGVEALRAIVGLNFLSTSAPVSFQLALKPLSKS
ncbi:hypothetical protein B9Z45_01170 [Limnohabitans sp. 2KL-17]|jgi:polyisoprenoid-binding protein YceI|uniref:YceI family protein n=1 Tax=Limnohabitans sp. 2KL-17 TaxID=1100704 RepID=UPI000D378266|nr:YceI family protein [Limnohabitans sp. 2KL-17]PUE62994.1 hypothetical protein B9Z45_01170 [Limnohabitans sp. 2KL-17]